MKTVNKLQNYTHINIEYFYYVLVCLCTSNCTYACCLFLISIVFF